MVDEYWYRLCDSGTRLTSAGIALIESEICNRNLCCRVCGGELIVTDWDGTVVICRTDSVNHNPGVAIEYGDGPPQLVEAQVCPSIGFPATNGR